MRLVNPSGEAGATVVVAVGVGVGITVGVGMADGCSQTSIRPQSTAQQFAICFDNLVISISFSQCSHMCVPTGNIQIATA